MQKLFIVLLTTVATTQAAEQQQQKPLVSPRWIANVAASLGRHPDERESFNQALETHPTLKAKACTFPGIMAALVQPTSPIQFGSFGQDKGEQSPVGSVDATEDIRPPVDTPHTRECISQDLLKVLES